MSHADSGCSAASTDDAGASSSQNAAGQQAEVIEGETEEGGASNKVKAFCVVEPAKSFDVRPGTEFAVPQAVIDAIESFKVPADFQQEGAREDSFMYSLGNYVKPKPTYLNKDGSKSTTAKFYCQLSVAMYTVVKNHSVYWIAAVYSLSLLLSPSETHLVGFRTIIWRVSWTYMRKNNWRIYWPGQPVNYYCHNILCQRPALDFHALPYY